MAGPSPGSPEYLAERNDPGLDQRVSIAFIVINTVFLAIFYVSRYLNPKAVVTPMLVCNTLCYIFCLGSATAGIIMTKIGGVGHHSDAVPIATLQTWLKLSKVLEFTYTPAVMFAKLAALFLYHHVFQVTAYRRVMLAIGVIIILQGIIALILAASICRPFRYFWTAVVDAHDGSCGDVMLFYKTYSIPSLVTDLAMLVIPWPILITLQMPTMEKIGLMLTFLAASMGIITCALRLSVFFTVPLLEDPTWYASGGPVVYAVVEPSIYMIASILPTTRHLFRRLHHKLHCVGVQSMDSRESGRGAGGGNGRGSSHATHSASEMEHMDRSGNSSRHGRGKTRKDNEFWQGSFGHVGDDEELTLGSSCPTRLGSKASDSVSPRTLDKGQKV